MLTHLLEKVSFIAIEGEDGLKVMMKMGVDQYFICLIHTHTLFV